MHAYLFQVGSLLHIPHQNAVRSSPPYVPHALLISPSLICPL